jgi:eukaryotic-like serine/threonine-protein kinase
MAMPWDERWAREGRGQFQGGQSVSFTAIARDGSGVRAFVKTLRRDRLKDVRARGRFRREATAYETLAALGPPRLFDDNADTWRDLGSPMYMALEYIDGVDLQKIIQRNGRAGLDEATACTRELAEVLHRCDQNNVTHRDGEARERRAAK